MVTVKQVAKQISDAKKRIYHTRMKIEKLEAQQGKLLKAKLKRMRKKK